MTKMAKILLAVAAVVAIVELAMATNYTVGAPSGSWNQQTNLTQWAESNTFKIDDVLIFSYNPSEHDVLEVTPKNFDSCNTSNPISTHTDGNTIVNLTRGDTSGVHDLSWRYFICGFTGHCLSGQKVQIKLVYPLQPSSPDSAATTVTVGAGLVFGLNALLAF